MLLPSAWFQNFRDSSCRPHFIKMSHLYETVFFNYIFFFNYLIWTNMIVYVTTAAVDEYRYDKFTENNSAAENSILKRKYLQLVNIIGCQPLMQQQLLYLSESFLLPFVKLLQTAVIKTCVRRNMASQRVTHMRREYL